MPSATVASITFAASSVLAYAGAYTVKVSAGFGSNFASPDSTILASATIAYTYLVDRCAANSWTFNGKFADVAILVSSSSTQSTQFAVE